MTRLARPAAWVAVPTFAHLAPSTLVLAQWWPLGWPLQLRALPGAISRWKGPETGRPELALTFDDGPDVASTPRVLDALDERNMRGTFFCLGERAERYPELVREIHDRGHEVAVHGYRHQRHLFATGPQLLKDLRMGVESLASLGGGLRPRYFRPPYGQVSAGSLFAAYRCGLELVLWSAWGREWADRSAESVAERISRRLEPAAIVLLHDSEAHSPPGTARVALQALRAVLDELGSRGLVSVRMADLLVAGAPSPPAQPGVPVTTAR